MTGFDDDGDGDTFGDGDTSVTPVSPSESAGQIPYGDSGDSGDTPTCHRTRWSAVDLMATTFPVPRWAVPGIIAEGVTVLGGPPKIGKSWFSYGLAVAVATGGKALGRIDVVQGDVLYLALEDTPRRLQNRLATILGSDPAPARLDLWTTCPPLPTTGAAEIGAWLDTHPDARLVIIDVLVRVRGTPPPGQSIYEADYRAVAWAKKIADTYRVAVVVVHHLRKMEATDWLDELSGSQGIAGAADAIAIMKRPRGEADAVLHVTGRDVEETDYAMRFAPAQGMWTLLDGPALDHIVQETRAKILAYVRANPGTGPTAIAKGTGLKVDAVKQTVRRMADDGQLTAKAGRYHPPGDTVTGKGVTGVTGVTVPPLSSGNDGDTTVTPIGRLSPSGPICMHCRYPVDSVDHMVTCEMEGGAHEDSDED